LNSKGAISFFLSFLYFPLRPLGQDVELFWDVISDRQTQNDKI